jgi:DNA-binding MarR family transcriptional regulator
MSDEPRWLSADELAAWVKLIAVLEMLPGRLDQQLRQDSGLSHFEYYVLAMLSEAPQRTLQMTSLAERTNGSLARLSHVVSRLEAKGLIRRQPCPDNRRVINASLTDHGWTVLSAAAPGHVATVRDLVIDALTPAQVSQLNRIASRLLTRLDPDHTMDLPIGRGPQS